MIRFVLIFVNCWFLFLPAETEFDAVEFLEAAKLYTAFQKQRQKNFLQVREKIKPRGASIDGQFAVFEKRSITHPQLIEFIVFDTALGTRSFFLSPTQQIDRKSTLSRLSQETKYLEKTIDIFQNINGTIATVSFTYADIFLEIYREPITQNLLLDIWKVLPLQKRQLFCRYPISSSPFVSGKIDKIYSFDKNNGFAVQICVQQGDQIFLDILSFHLEKGFATVASEQLASKTFSLTLKDKNQMFLKDIHYALGEPKRVEKQKIYFLGGLSKTIPPPLQ